MVKKIVNLSRVFSYTNINKRLGKKLSFKCRISRLCKRQQNLTKLPLLRGRLAFSDVRKFLKDSLENKLRNTSNVMKLFHSIKQPKSVIVKGLVCNILNFFGRQKVWILTRI